MRTPAWIAISLVVVGCSTTKEVPPEEKAPAAAAAATPARPTPAPAPRDRLKAAQTREHVPLDQLPISALLGGLPVGGVGTLSYVKPVDGNYAKGQARFQLTCEGPCTVGDHQAKLQVNGGLSFGKLTFDELDIAVEVQDGRAKLTRWHVVSPDLSIELSLEAEMAARFEDSKLTGCLRFQGAPGLEKRDPKTAAVIAMTGAQRGDDGFFTIAIGGTIGARTLMAVPCH